LTSADESDTIITDEDRKAVERTLSQYWYIYKDKKTAKIYPYHSDHVLKVKINGFGDFEVIEKKKYKPVGGE